MSGDTMTDSIDLDEQGVAMWRVFGVFAFCAMVALLWSYAFHPVSERATSTSLLTTAPGGRPSGAATPGAATNPPAMPAGLASGRPVGLPAQQERGH